MSRARKYSREEMEAFAQMFAEVTLELDRNPDQDFLGDLFMSLDLGNQWKGQFFTPYSVCRAMSAMTYGDDLKEKIEKRGWVSVNDRPVELERCWSPLPTSAAAPGRRSTTRPRCFLPLRTSTSWPE